MKAIASLLIVSFLLMSNSQRDNDEVVHWNPDYKLKWEDFQGVADFNSKHAAFTTYAIKAETQFYNSSEIVLDVFTIFKKNKSWCKSENLSDYLLDHEQKHMDLTEYYSRLLREELQQKKAGNSVEAVNWVNGLLKKYRALNEETQSEYDLETDHSCNKLAQLYWNTKIDSLLDSRNAFVDSEIVIEFGVSNE